MAYCPKCGSAVADDAAFCPACGTPQHSPTAAPPGPIGLPSQSQMSENVAAALSYVLMWLTGLIFYFTDKRPFVRFHAAQSIVLFGGLHIITIALTFLFGFSSFTGGWAGFSLGLDLYRLVDLVALVLWVLLMIKAYQGQKFRVPFAADIAESIFGKN